MPQERSGFRELTEAILGLGVFACLSITLVYIAVASGGTFIAGLVAGVGLCCVLFFFLMLEIMRLAKDIRTSRSYKVDRRPFLLLLGPFDRQLADVQTETKGRVLLGPTHDYEEIEFEAHVPSSWAGRLRPVEDLIAEATTMMVLKIGGKTSESALVIDAPPLLWRHTFATLARSAAGVLMLPGTSRGLLTELVALQASSDLSSRTLVLQPPGTSSKPNEKESKEITSNRGGLLEHGPTSTREKSWQHLRESSLGTRLPLPPYDPAGQVMLLSSRTPNPWSELGRMIQQLPPPPGYLDSAINELEKTFRLKSRSIWSRWLGGPVPTAPKAEKSS